MMIVHIVPVCRKATEAPLRHSLNES